MSLTLRPATPTDAGAVGAILSEFVDDTPWMPRIHTRAEDLAHAGDLIARGWVTVAETDGVQGFLARDGEDIQALYLTAPARGQGIGRALIEDAKARSPRLMLWTFVANEGARRFYDTHGFREVTRTTGDNDEGLPDIRLLWERTPA